MGLTIRPARSGSDRRRFIGVPWRVYDPALHPQWVPPLRAMVKDVLDTRRNPFYERADIGLFLAERDGRPVGRIAAIENRAHNDFHNDRVGFFGFFECRDDPEAANALFGAASVWLRDRSLEVMRGPVSPSTNHECGLLVRGFRHHPMLMTPWNPRYYVDLYEGAGLDGAKDLLAYFFPADEKRFRLPERFAEHAERLLEKGRISFRDADLRRFEREIEVCWEIYNHAWDRNWGFVPMTRDEFVHSAREMRHFLRPEFAFIAEADGDPAGFMLILPDLNVILKRIPSGRLLPFGVFKLLFGIPRILVGRIVALGVKERYRSRGIFQLFAHEAYRRAREIGAVGAEASWILEDNELLNRPLKDLGAKAYRRWRIYEKGL